MEITLNIDLVAVGAAGEVAVLLDLAATHAVNGARLVIRAPDDESAFTVSDDLPVCGVDDGVMVELGDLSAGEQRRIALGFEVPGLCGLGARASVRLETPYGSMSPVDDRDWTSRCAGESAALAGAEDVLTRFGTPDPIAAPPLGISSPPTRASVDRRASAFEEPPIFY